MSALIRVLAGQGLICGATLTSFLSMHKHNIIRSTTREKNRADEVSRISKMSSSTDNASTGKLAYCKRFLSSCAQSSLPSSLAAVKAIPSRYAISTGKYLSSSTVFGIRDTLYGWTGWVLRMDKPHKGHEYAHININRIYTHKPDPHTKLPPGAIPVFGTLTKVIKGVGDVVFYAAAAADTYMIGEAAVKDYQKTGTVGQETANTAVVVGARWAGALSGATLGGQAGLVIGSLVGTLCFGMTVPGAAVGSLVGSLYCGVAGGAAATNVAQDMTKSDVGYMDYIKNNFRSKL